MQKDAHSYIKACDKCQCFSKISWLNTTKTKNEEGIRLHLDLLDEVRVTTEQWMARYQDLMAKHYNAKVKPWHFSIGDLVLRKVTTVAKNPT